MESPSLIFRDNLHRLTAELLGIHNAQALATHLGFKLSNLRWIKRIWAKGLDRVDSRRADDLKKLAAVFGIKPEDFWKPRVQLNQFDIVYDPNRWAEFSREVIEDYCHFQQFKVCHRESALRALNYCDYDEARLVADIAAVEFGVERTGLPQHHLADLRKQMRRITKSTEPGTLTAADDDLVNFVLDQSRSHEWFAEFMVVIKRKHGESAEQHIRNIILDIQRRSRSHAEVRDEFQAICLDSFTDNDGFEAARKMINRHLQQMWRVAVQNRDSMAPEVFAAYIVKQLRAEPEAEFDDVSPNSDAARRR